MCNKINLRNLVLLLIVIAVAAIRVLNNFSPQLTALANYSPLVAVTMFGATYFKDTLKAVALPLLIIFISDIFLFATVYRQYSNGVLYSGWLWVYGAFLLMAVISRLLLRKLSFQNIVLTIVLCIFIHWLLTDYGTWLGSKMYPQTWAGFNLCLAAALPFELRLLSATIIYGAIMFIVFDLMKKRFRVLNT